MDIDRNLILKVASLARLKLSDEEVERFTPELKEIIGTFAKISKAKTDGIEPSFHPVPVRNRLREDKPKDCLSNELALKNSTQNQEGYFKGPKAV
jgi:aspartyl-tRNA(Asn)/glutamyl-tRNA(Gln) amidotransferase subunit C